MTATALFDEVLRTVGLAIIGGALAPGSRLTLADVEERFGVSRTLSRDVVKSLDSLGLVESRRRAGIEVLPPSSWLVLDPQVIAWRMESDQRLDQIASLTQVREGIEPTAARLAAIHGSGDHGRELEKLATDLISLAKRGLGVSPRYLDADVAYHRLLLEASGNEMLRAMGGMVESVLRGRAAHGMHPAWPELAAVETHLATARAIQRRDAEAAEASARAQLRMVHDEIGSCG